MTPLRAVRLALTLLLTLVPPCLVSAQSGLGVGTAAGQGITAVTEARQADAVWWNPAAVGIWDGPLATFSFLAVDITRIPGTGWVDGAAAFGAVPAGEQTGGRRLLDLVAPFGGGAGGAASVRWAAFHTRDLALTLSSHADARFGLPEAIAGALGIPSSGAASVPRRTARTVSTVASATKAAYHGSLPGLDRTWLGLTGKAWYVQSHAAGEFLSDLPGPEVYRETVLGGVPGLGVDLGILVAPTSRLRLGASLANVYSRASRVATDVAERVVSVQPEGGRYSVSVVSEPELDLSVLDDPAYSHLRELWDRAYFPKVLRGGASLDLRWLTVAAAAGRPIDSGSFGRSTVEPAWSLSVRGRDLPVSLAASGAPEGRRRLGGAISLVGCRRRLTLGIDRWQESGASGFGGSITLSHSDMLCDAP